jgi:phosphatidylserine decarboxylase
LSDNSIFKRLTQHERINFLVTNRIPRRYATLLMGRVSRVRHPAVVWISLKLWRLFAQDLDLHEAKQSRFESLHDCFIRELKPGSRPINADADVIVSPCDAIVGAHGEINDTQVFQAKGFPYSLADLVADPALVERYRYGRYVTLRLKSTMYHRFHAPCDSSLREVAYISGDTWNVNPIALKRVEKLYCKNERAVLDLQLEGMHGGITLVAVAAILVASIKLHCLAAPLNLRYRGPNKIACDATFKKGAEMGYFEHGSTIIVLATSNFGLCEGVRETATLRMGEPLLRKIAKEPAGPA